MPPSDTNLHTKLDRVRSTSTFRRIGRTTQVIGLTLVSQGPSAALGDLCHIELPDGSKRAAEVVGFRDSQLLLMPLGNLEGIGPGLRVIAEGKPFSIQIGPQLLGRVVDGLGRPVDDGPLEGPLFPHALHAAPPDALRRERVTKALPLGVRAVDAFITCGMGQRVGIFGDALISRAGLREAEGRVRDHLVRGEAVV